jgi:endoglucanase
MNEADILKILKKLVGVHAPSGFEDPIRPLMINELEKYVDEIKVDPLGNVIGIKRGSNPKGPKVMLSAHMDEIGLIVKHITDDGFIYFEKLGMMDDRILLARKVRIHTKNGPIQGVIGVKPKHLLSPDELARPVAFRDMWIDIGAQSRREAKEMGVLPGDPVTFEGELQTLNRDNFVVGRALDNRLGCTALIQAMKELSNENNDATIYAVATVMEEVGGRGAKVAASAINPDLAVALDVTHGIDPGVTAKWSAIQLGGGPSIRLMDIHQQTLLGCTTPVWLKNLILSVAEGEDIPYQIDILSGTFLDSSTIHLAGKGIPSVGILIPRRNGHTPVEIACLDDLRNSIRLLSAFMRKLTPDNIAKFGSG